MFTKRLFAALALLMLAVWPVEEADAQPIGPVPSKKIIVLGDSLSAGYGLPGEQAFPAVLQRELAARGVVVDVINAGVSGDTSSGGLARLDWALGEDADAVIVELGANDMLRGIDPVEMEKALDAILVKLTNKKLPVLLAGMIAAPGMGKIYEEQFNTIYARLADRRGVLLYPFFLEGVAAQKNMLLPDGMHPNRQGVEEMVRRILPRVLELAAQIKR